MKKTELIRNAINQLVIVEWSNDIKQEGWLATDNNEKNHYLLLPLKKEDANYIMCFTASQIKHLTFVNNKCRLW